MSSQINKPPVDILNRRTFVKEALGGAALTAFSAHLLNAGIYTELERWNQKYEPHHAPDGAYWDYIASLYMLEPDLIMMNNGTAGTMPRVVFNTIVKYFRIQAENPYKCYTTFQPYQDIVRRQIAEFIGASEDEIALLRNSTEGLNIIAHGLDLKPGDEVLMSNQEHPSGIEPWRMQEKRRGIKIKEAILDISPKSKNDILNAFNDAITPRTRVILCSHAFYKTGLIAPVKELAQLAHDKNILLAVDGAHNIGMLDLDMHDIGADLYVNSAYKWLGAPTGCGIFYVQKDVQHQVWPSIVSYDWEKTRGARKYDSLGRVAEPLIIAMGEAIRFQSNIGKPRIERRIRTLATYLKENAAKIPRVSVYTPMDPDLNGGLSVLGIDGVKVQILQNYLLEKHNMVVGATLREKDAVRVCTHIWISFKQIDALLGALRKLSELS